MSVIRYDSAPPHIFVWEPDQEDFPHIVQHELRRLRISERAAEAALWETTTMLAKYKAALDVLILEGEAHDD